MTFDLFLSESLIAFHDCGSIYVAKAFNSYIAQILSPSLACMDKPGHTWTSVWRQSVFCIVVSILYIHVALKTSTTINRYNPTIAFIFKHILAWAFKELTAIFVAMMSTNLVDKKLDPVRLLRDYLQGDAQHEEDLEWYIVASYFIFVSIFLVVTLLVFVFVFEHVKSAFWKLNSLLLKAPWTPTRKVFMNVNDERESDRVDEENEIDRQTCLGCCTQKSGTFYREDSDGIAYDFTNECLRTSYAWVVNGVFTGILISVFTDTNSEVLTFTFGLLEIYSLLACIIGGLVFSSTELLKKQMSKPIWKFYWQWWATWAGLAIATLGVAPGSISYQIERSGTPSILSDLARVIINTLFAAFFLYLGSSARVKKKLFGCFVLSDFVAIKIGELLINSSILGVAVSWEDFGGDLACSFADLEQDNDGFSAIAVSGIYFVMVIVILLPLSIPVGIYGRTRLKMSLQKIAAFNDAERIKHDDQEQTENGQK